MNSPSAWPRRLALAVAALTLPLIFMGGRVTSTGSGMAVPDWPTTFGENMFFFPWSKWVGPVLIEHTHRLAAAIVGLATILLAVVMAVKETRPRVRWLGVVALALVIGQGVLGGMRVVLYEHGLAPVHGCVAQAFFAFVMFVVALTSKGAGEPATIAAPRALAVVTLLAGYAQVVLGAWYRHTAGARLEPHGFFAAVVFGLAIALAVKAKKDPVLRRWTRALHAFLGVQVLLGIASWQLKPSSVPNDLKVALVSTHLVFGALVVGTIAAITTLCFRSRRENDEPQRSERPQRETQTPSSRSPSVVSVISVAQSSVARDILTLVRPRIAVMVLVTVAVGAALAAQGAPPLALLVHALLGTLLVAGSSSALNQVLEVDTDKLMERTANRPLPTGRFTRRAVTIGALLGGAIGLAELVVFTNATAALVALASWAIYVLAYTPLKRRTSLNTAVGAIPGALPPVIGWAAVEGSVPVGAWVLFAIVFTWQFPHFLAIAWLNREQYAKAGLKMLPAIEGGERITGWQMTNYCLALLPVSLAPAVLGVAGRAYFAGALYLGVAFLAVAVLFTLRETRANARRLLVASLVYLPAVLMLLCLDRLA